MKKKFLLQLTILTMRATNIKATRGAVATIHSGSDRRKKSKTIESTLDQVTGDFHSNFTARARTRAHTRNKNDVLGFGWSYF
jgi:hypothetical protein